MLFTKKGEGRVAIREAKAGRDVAMWAAEMALFVEDPERLKMFTHFANDAAPDPTLEFIEERGQKRPADWTAEEATPDRLPPEDTWSWMPVGAADSIPRDSGRAIRVPHGQIAVFHHAALDRYFATDNLCPHKRDMVLARGLLGAEGDEPKVACPLHKKTFSLHTGKGLSDPDFCVRTYPIENRGGELFVKLPAAPAGGGG